MFAAFPLLALPVIVYNLLVLTLAGGLRATTAQQDLGGQMFSIHMASGAPWVVSLGDLILAGALVVCAQRAGYG